MNSQGNIVANNKIVKTKNQKVVFALNFLSLHFLVMDSDRESTIYCQNVIKSREIELTRTFEKCSLQERRTKRVRFVHLLGNTMNEARPYFSFQFFVRSKTFSTHVHLQSSEQMVI